MYLESYNSLRNKTTYICLVFCKLDSYFSYKYQKKSPTRSDEIVRIIKLLCHGFVYRYSKSILTYSRTLDFNQLPDYDSLGELYTNVVERMGYSPNAGPLDWTPSYPEIANFYQLEPEVLIPNEHVEEDDQDFYVLGRNCYFQVWDGHQPVG